MFIHSKLVILILVLTLDRQGHTIYGGQEVVPHSRPYMVLLEMYMLDGHKKYCSGFILSEDFVMTAAHCQANSYRVFLGLHNVHNRTEVQHIPVEQAFPHKGYNATSFINDVMLLKLSSGVIFNNKVRPIAIRDLVDGCVPKSCTVSGWGRSDRNNSYMTPSLMEVSVTLIHSKWCAKEETYCSEGDTGPSQGDGGSPLVCGGKVYGVSSATFTSQSGAPMFHRFAKIPNTKNLMDLVMKHPVCGRVAG